MFARQSGGKRADKGKEKCQLLRISRGTWNVKPGKRAAKKVDQRHGREQQKASDKQTFPNNASQNTRCHFPALSARLPAALISELQGRIERFGGHIGPADLRENAFNQTPPFIQDLCVD